jgi:nucleoside phosphorylase
VLNGQQQGSDLVGCEAASVATLSAIQRLHPDIIINSGTCGAFRANGAEIAEVYIGNGVMFHDRRVPGDDAWGTQSLGNYPVWEGSTQLAQALGFKMGKVTTGSSLDMQPCDFSIIQQHGGELKDMEGAAVGFVCSLFKTPILYVKSVTDLCDGGAETFEEFSRNLHHACETLKNANERIIEFLTLQQ